MGVPKFFRYISERYPCLSEIVKEHQIPEFDYLYLDMNGIIHTCSHPTDDVCFRISEEMIFKNIFHYIEILFNMIRPQKLFFMAIDGVAPRAKINQQRGRRFRAAKDAEVQEAKARSKGIPIPTEKRFDSNCITPGTLFMSKLSEQLKCFIEHKISTNDEWKKCKILFSGSEVPGEGEHKIMDYIRYMKASKDYNSDSRHCLYGLDADLIMLGLCSHEPNFSLLREEVKFGKQQVKLTPEETKFCLLHLSLLREYIEHEFSLIKDKLPFPFDIEKIIDDWVLMGFLVGNDFIPHLPNLHIANGALPILYRAYKEVLPTLDGYINEAGTLKLDRFEKFMEKLSRLDVEQFNEHYADIKFFESKTGRRPNESERHVYKKLKDNESASPKKTQVKDLEDVFIDTTNMFLGNFDDDDDVFEYKDMDLIDDESDSEVYNMEFVQHKKDYYINKLEYENVDEEVLRSQAEGYVRAIQWNLHYYYHGCCSWSWYYPHHYAPYISDIKDFKDLKLEFDLGEPFLPFQQLLAVLPALSKDLLPEAFQSLLTEESSPIINYYPHNFKTDLNGKRQEWEAVVLIPFIDEKLLVSAMRPHLSRLTIEEQARNKHGPMCLYSYSDEIRNVYKATTFFPEFNNQSEVKLMSRDDIFVPREKLIRGLSPGFDLNVYYPGFPTLRHLDHTAHLEKAKVKVFQQHSLEDNMILSIKSKKTPSLTTLASELLGKNVYVEWPHLKEALVIAVADCNTKLSLINPLDDYSHDNLKKEDVKGLLAAEWSGYDRQIKEILMSRHGIDIGDTSVLLYTRLYLGHNYNFGSQGKVAVEKQWNECATVYAYQTVVKDISVYSKKLPVYETMHDIFIPGTFCFMLGHPYYGAMGEVMQNKDISKSRRIKIFIKTIREPTFESIKQAYMHQKTRFMHGSIAAQRLGISSHLLSRITGTIFVIQAVSKDELTKHNVGLNLKFNKRNEEVSGYTKKENTQWLYSMKAVELIRNYMTKCPKLFERLAKNVTNDIFQEEDLFDKGSDELMDTVKWLKAELHGLESRPCGMDVIETDLIKQLEEEVEKFLEAEQTTAKTVYLQVKPQLLYKPGLHLRSVPPDVNSQNRLFDRIRCVRSGFSVPLGSKGTIIGIRNGSNSMDTTYDVLFDKPFMGGLTLNGCSQFRGYRLTSVDFVNISFGERTEQGNPANESVECRKQQMANSASPKRDNNQLSKTIPQMQLAKKGLEKLNRDICLRMAQHGMLEVSPKTIPCKTFPQNPQNAPPNQATEFQELWNELHKIQKPNGPPEKVIASIPVATKIKPFSNNHNMQPQQDPSAFLKAMLKIPDVNLQPNKQECKQQSTVQFAGTSQKATVSQKDQVLKPPPLVQQLFDHARRTEQKTEKANPIWYSSQLLRHFSYNGANIPKYKYIVDEKTGLINAHVMLENSKIFKGDACTTHEQATESAAKKAYKTLNLNKTSMHDTKILMAPHWFNAQQQNNWIQNIRPPMIPPPMGPPLKIPPVPQNIPMQPNLFYPKWNPKLPPNPAFGQIASYNQGRQQQVKHLGQQKGPQNGPKMEIRNSTAFVPLQAQKKNRNTSVQQASRETNLNTKKSSSPKAQQKQHQQKQEEIVSKKQKPEIVNKAKEKTSSELQQQTLQQPQQNAGKSSKPRKSRVAAKFGAPPLSKGAETLQ